MILINVLLHFQQFLSNLQTYSLHYLFTKMQLNINTLLTITYVPTWLAKLKHFSILTRKFYTLVSQRQHIQNHFIHQAHFQNSSRIFIQNSLKLSLLSPIIVCYYFIYQSCRQHLEFLFHISIKSLVFSAQSISSNAS